MPRVPTPDGFRSKVRDILRYPLPAGVGWAHSLGGLLLFLFGVQLLTGILLALYYSPSTSEAWESVRYIENEVRAGSLIRGIHHWASTAFIVLLCCHLARTFLWGAYKGRRRWTWVVGCLLLLAVLGFGFTGYLLPWDLKAYFGTRVGVEIAGAAPLLGDFLKKFLQGGNAIGELTLPRFYALHSVVLPLATSALIAFHLALIRSHGITAPWTRVDQDQQDQSKGSSYYYPEHLAKELAAAFALALVLVGLAVWIGAPLEARADPLNSSYVPRPEWYFLGLQQLLRLFQGKLEILGTVILPGMAVGLMFALPWLDRNPERSPKRRPIAMTIGATFALAVVGLTAWGYQEVRNEDLGMAARKAAQAAELPSENQTTADPSVSTDSEALVTLGESLYKGLNCGGCHDADGAGTGVDIPSSLAFQGSRAHTSWVTAYLKKPHRIRFESEGVRGLARMPDFLLTDREAEAVASFLATRKDPQLIPEGQLDWSVDPTGEQVREGRRLLEQYQCLGCHTIDAEGSKVGPVLDKVGRRRRPEYLHALVLDPQRVIPGTAMKNSGLWEEEALAIVQYLRTLR